MRFSIASSLLFLTSAASAASSWGFKDGSVTVASKQGHAATAKFSNQEPVKDTLILGKADTIKVSLTTTEGSEAKRPHQAFIVITESTGIEVALPLDVKSSGKAVASISHKDISVPLLLSEEPLKVNLVLGSFGSSSPLISPVFNIQIYHVPNTPLPAFERPMRYGRREEIHHVFKVGETSPPKIISIVFVTAIVCTFPLLLVGWSKLGANLDHLPKAFQTAPISHALFVGSIIAIEGSFFLYYVKWNLFQLLPVFAGLSIVAFLSGVKALSEVQGRRFAERVGFIDRVPRLDVGGGQVEDTSLTQQQPLPQHGV
ncbi:hypothetical protein FGSG_09399 [Fusarium graminearum PH-1]|uniref:hypothetical protein n=1 Tax=Gibberella zeae (strain ATCC MYA-4620 / CBS 123657 / FGSC 9075 / NRRL 31084 / PH-1) TaxID=229533 RepID=UPI00021F1C2B|nr:hypothetical protein FGSG_09399 [Fusarium graminearum PH-1]ESU15970.1 hypothetical protein FGSG_09399 [Fusarium graminearum PH-1]|eukprot:XP_011328346.1 hypothetical protein FGSG_09399 [Fusarium graminearum PH-1]